jgi:hypothetical protein
LPRQGFEVTFFPNNISAMLQLAAAATHLYEQHKRENADRCLPAIGTPADATPSERVTPVRAQFKLLEDL